MGKIKGKSPSLRERTGAALKAARIQANMTQQAVGDELSASRIAVAQLESGKENLTLDTIERFAKALGAKVHIRIEK